MDWNEGEAHVDPPGVAEGGATLVADRGVGWRVPRIPAADQSPQSATRASERSGGKGIHQPHKEKKTCLPVLLRTSRMAAYCRKAVAWSWLPPQESSFR